MHRLFILTAVVGLSGCLSPRPGPPGPVAWSGIVREIRPEQETPELGASPLPLENILRVAMERNAGLRAADRRWEAARLVPQQASALPDPMVTLTRFVDEISTRNGPIEWQFGLQQQIPFPGKLGLRGGIAEQDALIAWERYMAAGLDLVAKVKNAYYEHYWIQRALRVSGENKDLLEQILQVAQTKYAASQVTQQDVLKAQMELAKISEQLNSLRDMHGTIVARINRTLNRAPDAPLGDPPDLKVDPFEADIEGLTAEALRNSPEIRSADHAIRRGEEAESLAKMNFLPDFTVQGTYSVVERTDLAGAPDSGKDAWGVGVGITIPLWWGKRKAALEESRELLHAAKLEREQAEHDTKYKVTDLRHRLQIAFRQVKLYRDDLVPQARQALEVARAGYAAVPPKVDFESVIDNQRRLLGFQLALERARADFHQRMAELERTVGRLLSEKKP